MKKAVNLIQRWGRYLVTNPLVAGAFAFSMALTPLLSLPLDWISRVVLVFITLVKGYQAGLVIAVWCLLPAIALGVTINMTILAFVGITVLLAWASGVMLRRFHSWSLLIEVLGVVGLCAVLGFHIVLADVAQWWMELLSSYSVALGRILGLTPAEVVAFRTNMLPVLVQYTSGLQAAFIMLGVLLNVWIARAWQASIYSPGSLRKACHRIRLSRAMALLWLFLFGLGVFAGSAPLRDALPVLSVPLILAGLSLIHFVVSRYAYGWVGLIVVYITCLYWPYLLGLIALAAWIDSWYNLRAKLVMH